MEFIDFFQGFQKPDGEENQDMDGGIVDIICGCMISKWTSVEFTKVFGLEKDYLQIAVIYMEPFCGYDYCLMYMDFEKVPASIMELYTLARTHTISKLHEDDDTQISMYIPYAYNTSRKTVHKTYSVSHYNSLFGKTINLEGLYINSSVAFKKLENIFNKV